MQISMISGEFPDAEGTKPGYTPNQCFEPMLYWSFTLLPQSAGKTRNIKHGNQVVQVHGPESRFVPPSLMMERYFPNLHRHQLVTMSHFETSTWLLFIANTTEPFRGWLQMCLDFNLSFFRLPNAELMNSAILTAHEVARPVELIQLSSHPQISPRPIAPRPHHTCFAVRHAVLKAHLEALPSLLELTPRAAQARFLGTPPAEVSGAARE